MTRSAFRRAQGGEGTRTAKLSFESEPEGSSLRVEDRVILSFDPFDRLRIALRPSKGENLRTPRKIEGRRIEG